MARNPALGGRHRALLTGAISLLVVLLAATPALADTVSGKHGHYVVTDTSSHPGATCNYTPTYPTHYLVSFSVRAPSLWWPNTSSSINNESGTVSWQPFVQHQGGSGWQTVASGSKQMAVAHEDRPLHDAADKAPLTNQTVSWAASGLASYRVVVKAVWYKSDSSVMGTVKHVVKRYRLAYPGYSAPSSGSCPPSITILG